MDRDRRAAPARMPSLLRALPPKASPLPSRPLRTACGERMVRRCSARRGRMPRASGSSWSRATRPSLPTLPGAPPTRAFERQPTMPLGRRGRLCVEPRRWRTSRAGRTRACSARRLQLGGRPPMASHTRSTATVGSAPEPVAEQQLLADEDAEVHSSRRPAFPSPSTLHCWGGPREACGKRGPAKPGLRALVLDSVPVPA